MRSAWCIPVTPISEKKYGSHPTQKPMELLKRLITAATNQSDTILDPFMGSGTTGVVAKLLKRKFIGIELKKQYVALAKKRIRLTNE
jgi:site-specific DNA-methyltransferase (adenine-specific)